MSLHTLYILYSFPFLCTYTYTILYIFTLTPIYIPHITHIYIGHVADGEDLKLGALTTGAITTRSGLQHTQYYEAISNARFMLLGWCMYIQYSVYVCCSILVNLYVLYLLHCRSFCVPV